MAELNKKFIVNLQGKDFITYPGLIDLAHQMKLKSITTEIIQLPNEDNNNQCIVKAVATTEDDKIFEGYGDADPTNVNRMIGKHLIRMSETRAKARALRDLTNVGMTAFEELGGEDEEKPANISTNNKALSEGQIKRLYTLGSLKGYNKTVVDGHIKQKYNKQATELNSDEYKTVCNGYAK